MNNVMEAIEAIVEADIVISEWSSDDGLNLPFSGKRGGIFEFLEAIQTIRDAYPEDLRERREAAAEYIKRNINADKGLDILSWSTDDLLRRLLRRRAVEPTIKPPEFCAWKRLLKIQTGDFSAESKYYQPEPDYPSQWLEYMSEKSAQWLYDWLECHGFAESNTDPIGYPPLPYNIVEDGFVVEDASGVDTYRVPKAPFITGGLELPDFVDEEEL